MHNWQICHPDKTTILKCFWMFCSLGTTNEVWFDCLFYLHRSYAGELGPKHWTNGRYEYVMKLKQAALNFAKKRWADYILVWPSLSIYTSILDDAYPNIYNRNIKKIKPDQYSQRFMEVQFLLGSEIVLEFTGIISTYILFVYFIYKTLLKQEHINWCAVQT